MLKNNEFELVNQRGWKTGFNNILRAELNRWWKTRRWLIQCVIWVGIVDLFLFIILNAAGAPNELTLPFEEVIIMYGLIGGSFTSIGVVILMQGAIVGEKSAGTFAWILSKPLSRTAIILAKLIGNFLGFTVTGIIVPGVVAYLLINGFAKFNMPLENLIAGIGVLWLFASYWFALTFMLGFFFKSRGPVIGIPIFLIFGGQIFQQLAMGLSPTFSNLLPYRLIMPINDDIAFALFGKLLLGQPITSWLPVFSSIVTIIIFILISIWRFRQEEL